MCSLEVIINEVKTSIDAALTFGVNGNVELEISKTLGQEGEMCATPAVTADAKVETRLTPPKIPIKTPAEYFSEQCATGVGLACANVEESIKNSGMPPMLQTCTAEAGLKCSNLHEARAGGRAANG